jgi:hypothetical protein
MVYAAETGLDRETDRYEIWQGTRNLAEEAECNE